MHHLAPTFIRADFADHEQIEELLTWTHPHLESSPTAPGPYAVIFTEAENLAMLRLPRKECKDTYTIFHFRDGNNNSKHSLIIDLTSPQETHDLYLTLLTLLFAYAYDARTTQHDPTPESAWTIATLITAFSALDPPPYSQSPHPPPQVIQNKNDSKHSDFDFESSELAESFIPSYRRAIAFPLYRSWALADECRKDVADFLLRGTRTVLRCLLELRTILDTHEVYYVYSRIWLDDFCRWIQACARYMVLRRGSN